MAKNENEIESSPMIVSAGANKKSCPNNHQLGHNQSGHNHHHHHHQRHHNNPSTCANSSSNSVNTDSLNSSGSVGPLNTMDNSNICSTHGHKNKPRNHQHRHRNHHGSGNGSHHVPSSHGHHRQNVAIATQVISPSAIGGSLKLSGPRRLCQHYDPEAEDDDSEGTGLFGRKKRLPWGKLSCYGASIGIIVLIMTGVVLAVGYMQSEKQRILSQSQKLSQEWNMSNGSIILVPTTWRPKIAYNLKPNITEQDSSESSSSHILTKLPMVLQTEMSHSSNNHIEHTKFEEGGPKEKVMDKKAIKTEENSDESVEDDDDGEEDHDDKDDDDDDEDDDGNGEDDVKELEIYEPKVKDEQSLAHESRDSEQTPSEITRAMPRMDNNAPIQPLLLPPPAPIQPSLSMNVDNPIVKEDEERHKSPSEVKVLPPKDFKFNGFSFGIPIYTVNSSTASFNNSDDNYKSESESELHKSNSSFSFNVPIIPTPTSKSTSITTGTEDSTHTSVQQHKFDFGIVPFNVGLNNFTSISTSSSNKHSELSSTNFTNTFNTQISGSDTNPNPTSSSENDFEALKKFLDSFQIQTPDASDVANVSEDTNTDSNQLPQPPVTAKLNSFSLNPDIASITSLQTDLFRDDGDGDDDNGMEANSKNNSNDDDHDRDTEMSASTNDNMRGRNARPPKMKIEPDNMYTPRPGTNPHYPDRPSRVFSSKSAGSYYSHPMDKLYSSNNNDDTDYNPNSNSNSNSDFSAYELTSSSVTTSTPIKPSQESKKISSKSSSNSGSGFKPLETNSHSNNIQNDKSKQETTTISTLSVNDYQLTSPPTSTPISFNLHNYNINPVTANPNANSVSTDSSNFHFDFSQLTTPSPLHGATPTSIFPDVLSKRTFNFGYDSSSGSGYNNGGTSNFNTHSNHNHNPFSDILGSQSSITSAIGTTSPTGATLGYNANFNFDSYNPYVNTGTGGGNSNNQIPSGTVPFDLASSYIQAGNHGQGHGHGSNSGGGGNSGGYNNLHASGSSNNYDFTSPYGSSPNSNPISLSQLIQNSAEAGARSAGYPNYGQLNTASSNQVPQYNTITQGIHLLSLLHGNIPDHLVDQQPSASNNYGQQSQSQHSENPQYQIAALTGYGGSSNAFLDSLPSSSSTHTTSHSSNSNFNPYLVSAESRNSVNTVRTDGSSASVKSTGNNIVDPQTSFSQNIVAKLADFSNIHGKKSMGDSISSGSESVSTVLTSGNLHQTKAPDQSHASDGEEKALSKILNIPSPLTSKNNGHKIPDMDTAASEIILISHEGTDASNNLIGDKPAIKPIINFAKKLPSKGRRIKEGVSTDSNERGLKSGFYI